MNKNAIQKFAIWARNELIAQVSQRAYQYGIDESGFGDASADTLNGRLLTAEKKSQRQELIKQIKEKGYKQVMEEVAYTWFNRFIALRFMEVNNYLPSHIRVFSDASGAFKPEILNDVLHLDLPGLDSGKVAEYIESNDTEALYRYLLLTQCNALNSALPVMFERMGGYTEMLLPNNILRQDSVLGHMVSDIPEEDWQDAVQIIGWLYQYYNTELKDDTFAQLKKNVKITKERIPAATQLFTPDWIVRYMVENSLGRLWLEGHPNAELHDGWKYYLDEAEQEPEVEAQLAKLREEYKTIKPEEIKVIDPCMGSGHILVYAFDVLMQIYTSAGWDQREAAQSILKNNLFGLDIDDRAAQLAYFAVMMKARQYDRRLLTRGIRPNIYSIRESNGIQAMTIEYFHKNDPKLKADIERIVTEMRDAKEYGSILNITPVDFAGLYARFDEIREDIDMMQKPALEELLPVVKCAEVLAQKYDVVVTNPPYMGKMPLKLSKLADECYPNYKYDAYALFVNRCYCMLNRTGMAGMITGDSWLTLSSFTNMRSDIISNYTLINLILLGTTGFDVGFGTTAFIFTKKASAYLTTYVDMRLGNSMHRKFYYHNNDKFREVIDREIIVCSTDKDIDILNGPICSEVLIPKAGIVAGNNDLYLRLWHEVSRKRIQVDARQSPAKGEWVPLHKGGGYRKWYGLHEFVIRLNKMLLDRKVNKSIRTGDSDFYFLEGITWSTLSNKFGVRKSPTGFVYNTKGSMCFPKDNADLDYIVSLLNSKTSEYFINIVAPNLDFNSGTIIKLPYTTMKVDRIKGKSAECVTISKDDWDSYETSWDFKRNPLV